MPSDSVHQRLVRLDQMATTIQDNAQAWGMPFEVARELVRSIDSIADSIEADALGVTQSELSLTKVADIVSQYQNGLNSSAPFLHLQLGQLTRAYCTTCPVCANGRIYLRAGIKIHTVSRWALCEQCKQNVIFDGNGVLVASDKWGEEPTLHTFTAPHVNSLVSAEAHIEITISKSDQEVIRKYGDEQPEQVAFRMAHLSVLRASSYNSIFELIYTQLKREHNMEKEPANRHILKSYVLRTRAPLAQMSSRFERVLRE